MKEYETPTIEIRQTNKDVIQTSGPDFSNKTENEDPCAMDKEWAMPW